MDPDPRLTLADALLSDGDPWVVCRAVRDGDGTVVDLEYLLANAQAEAAVGLGALAGSRMLQLVPEVRETLFPLFREALESGVPRSVGVPATARTGDPTWEGRWLAMEVRVCGEVLVVHWRDATAEREDSEAARRSQAHLTALVENASDVITVVSADGIIRYVTPAVHRVLGRTVLGEPITQTVRADHHDLAELVFAQVVAGEPGEVAELELPVQHADGHWIWIHVRASNHVHDPAVGGVVVNWRDITEQRALSERLRREALHDPLTGLPNRRLFAEELERAVARTQREDTAVGVVFCDLDHFKEVNDALGHPVGDELLQAVAARLQAAVRPADVVARLGGDEFVVLAEGLGPSDAAAGRYELVALAGRIHDSVRGGYRLAGRELAITATLGASIGRHPATCAELLAEADAALYEAKRFGRDRFELFDQDMHRRNKDRLSLEASLRRALGGGELAVHYQPQIDVPTGRTVGAEALVRWSHPERGLLLPGEFVPTAEESGLIVDVGSWVLAAAVRGAVGWEPGEDGRRPVVTVNLSARQLTHPALLDHVDAVLAASGLDPSRLEVEVTEGVALGDLRISRPALEALRERGIRVALDDFGTGWSSLTWLQRLPVDAVKLDRTVIADLAAGGTGHAVVEAVTAMAHALGKTVVAEGVETARQHEALRELGCDRAQGFLYGRPAAVLHRGVAPGC